MDYTVQPYGHQAWLVSFKHSGFSKLLCLNILRLAEIFRRHYPDWSEIVPAYDSLLLQPSRELPQGDFPAILTDVMSNFTPQTHIEPPEKIIHIPVHYGGADGPDIDHVAHTAQLSTEEVIARHCAEPYLVCLMGFIPGFAFMSETDPRLHIPRKDTPRASVPAGSVGLAGWQTGIYGLTSPGGWQIIGRTPLTLFDPNRETPFLLKAGDWIRFMPQSAPKGASC